jgi:DNA-binding NarL/FixJ family response regulator
MPIPVLVADDHPLVRDALVDLLGEAPGIEVVAACSDGSQVLDAVDRTHPSVVLLDLNMPVMGGLEAARGVRRAHPMVQVALLTGDLTAATACEARELGVAGYLLKEDGPDRLLEGIRTIAAGGTAWSAAALAVVERCRPPGTPSGTAPASPGSGSAAVGRRPPPTTSAGPDMAMTSAERGAPPRMTTSAPVFARLRAHLQRRDEPLESM